ncbi:MAG TPA: hypothetical protein VGV40_12250 [Solirubrobacteraceae bacterium]|nr:hypothetical protein [Solirubrobacteraceae bacterium]
MPLLRNFDLLVLVLALAIFVVAGLPLLGWVTAAVIWAMWRAVGAFTERRAEEAADLRRTAGLMAGSMIARGWAMGLILIAVGLTAGDDVGLSAAVLCVVLFTLRLTMDGVLRPSGGGSGPTKTSPT